MAVEAVGNRDAVPVDTTCRQTPATILGLARHHSMIPPPTIHTIAPRYAAKPSCLVAARSCGSYNCPVCDRIKQREPLRERSRTH